MCKEEFSATSAEHLILISRCDYLTSLIETTSENSERRPDHERQVDCFCQSKSFYLSFCSPENGTLEASKENGIHMCTLCNQIAVWNRLYRCKYAQECADMELIVRNLIGNPASESKIVTTKPFLNTSQTQRSFGKNIFESRSRIIKKLCGWNHWCEGK